MAQDAAQDATAVEPQATSALAAHVERAADYVKERKFSAALAEYSRALELAGTDADRATLEYNAGSCAFELGRFTEAEAHFSRSAELDPSGAADARSRAGLSALRDGRVEAAERYLALMPSSGAAERSDELAGAIARHRGEQAAKLRSQQIAGATAALRGGDARRAIGLLEQVLRGAAGVSPRERADLHYGLSAARLAAGDLTGALRDIDTAIALSPADAELYLKRADIELRSDERDAAALDLERALELGLRGEAAARAHRLFASLDPLPKSGPAYSLYVGAGYDSNPDQSGISDATGVAVDSGVPGSGFIASSSALGYTGRLGRHTAARLEYAPSVFALLARDVQDLSLQAHELGAHLYVAPSRSVVLRLSALSSLLLSGLDPIEPFTWENGGAGRLELRTGKHARTRLDLQARAVYGFEEQEALAGARGDAGLAEFIEVGDVSLTLALRLRGYRAGSTGFTIDSATEFPSCVGCLGAVYDIPLSYLAPSALVDVMWDVTERLALGAFAGLELRRYTEASGIRAAGPESARLARDSRKFRQDLRPRAGARAELTLDTDAHWALLAEYAWLASASNVAYDAAEPAHALDYGDYTYGQHVLEAGIEVRF